MVGTRVSPTTSILGALGRAMRREVGTFGSLKLNNVFLFVALMAYGAGESGVEPKSVYPFLLFLLTVMLFPLSADPLDKVPPSRLGVWPLTPEQRARLRVASILVSPVLWIGIALLLFKRVRPGIALAFLTAVIGVQAVAFLGRLLLAQTPRGALLRLVPPLPGRLGGLIRNHLRQMLQVLDFYIALIFSAGAVGYRIFAPHPEPEAFPVLSMLAVLALSTYGQVLFGLDRASGGATRYRLFPLHGWEILLSKDIAFLGIAALFTVFVDPLPGMTFALFALAAGHHASVLEKIPLRRWRFSGGRAFIGVVQCAGGFALGMAEHRVSPLFALAGVGAYLGSLMFYGWKLRG
jgi:hypothetical protein